MQEDEQDEEDQEVAILSDGKIKVSVVVWDQWTPLTSWWDELFIYASPFMPSFLWQALGIAKYKKDFHQNFCNIDEKV